MWQEVLAAIQEEFSDLPDPAQFTRVAVRLLSALLLGALIGFERERHEAPAGLRTHILVSLGAAVFVLVPQQAGMAIQDLSRVIQGVVSGIGFLGAGAVLKLDRTRRIHGLTTAGSIWATAAIGIAAGMGRQTTALMVTLLSLVVLSMLLKLEKALVRRGIIPSRSPDGGE